MVKLAIIIHRKLGGYKNVFPVMVFFYLVYVFLTFFKSFVFSLNNLLWLWFRHRRGMYFIPLPDV